MELIRINKYDPEYKKNILGGYELKNYSVYASNEQDKVGSVHDILVDELGYLRYLVIDTGFGIFGKKILLPIGRCQFNYPNKRVYAVGLTKKQLENLPEYDDNSVIDYNYEEKVRDIYRSPNYEKPVYDQNSYSYDLDGDLYTTNSADHGIIKLYEEKLVANKKRKKVGEVNIGKRVETERTRVSVPVETERIVINRKTPTNKGQKINPHETDFQEGEIARIELYQETAKIKKEAFVSEEVEIKKEVEKDSLTAEETLRKEKLEINVDGKPVINE